MQDHKQVNQSIELPKVRDLREHEWVVDVQDVSVDYETSVVIVRFRTLQVPTFIFESDAFDVKEVWVDTLPSWWARTFVSEQWARDYGFGKDSISVLVEVDE